MFKALMIVLMLATVPSAAVAVNVNGEYPICKTKRALENFTQHKMFNDYAKIQAQVEAGDCIFVEPDIKATILENTLPPKVIVFIPYSNPITGWTSQENLD